MAITIDFSGQVALITGGTKGVGKGIAQRFADAGAQVVVCARSIPDDLPKDWAAYPADLRDADQATALIDQIVDRFGHLDILVNNAGGSPPSDTSTGSANFA